MVYALCDGGSEGAAVLDEQVDYTADPGASGVTASFSASAGNVLLRVTGLVATTIDWDCVIDYQQR